MCQQNATRCKKTTNSRDTGRTVTYLLLFKDTGPLGLSIKVKISNRKFIKSRFSLNFDLKTHLQSSLCFRSQKAISTNVSESRRILLVLAWYLYICSEKETINPR